jgi:uncharacterized protein
VSDALPLFPLKTVLLPRGRLALRVFEPRYFDMVARCLRGANRFGVIAIRQGSEAGTAEIYAHGSTAEIVDWHRESGMLGIVAVGRERFRVVCSMRQPDGLYVAEVELLAPPAALALPERYAPLAALLRKHVEASAAYRNIDAEFDDAVWVADRLLESLPLALAVKQSLLEMANPLARLDRLAALLRTEKSDR